MVCTKISIGILLDVAAATSAAISRPCAIGTEASAVKRKTAMIRKLMASILK
jgi:hypothetical protein